MYKLVIFDLDGTLLNTIEDISDSLNYALKEAKLPLVSLDACKYMVGSGVDVLIERATTKQEARDFVKEKYLSYYTHHPKNKTHVYKGIKDTIDRIKVLGYKIAVFSNKPHEDTLKVIKHYFGETYFDYVLGHKTYNKPKPALDGSKEILDHFKLANKEVLYVGDTNIDMLTAQNANFDSVAVTWGFRKAHEIIPHKYIIDSPEELLKILEVL